MVNVAEPEVVLITGTSKGIGKYLVEHFVRKGALVEGCSRNPINWELKNYTHHITNVSNESQVKELISSINKRYGRLDIIINNAGVISTNHALLIPLETVENTMSTNFNGTFLICREGTKLMRKHKYGRIINITSIAVPMHLEGEVIYTASKAAVEALTRTLSYELAEFGITCNAVGPAPIETDIISNVPSEKIEDIVRRLAIKRLGKFEDVANVIDFFVKKESNYITGQVIYLGGV